MKRLLLLIALLIPSLAQAATVYIRDGGTGSGASWSDALDNLPSTLTRGNTYYVADGSYGAYTFNTAASGSTPVTIIKATVASHGTSTGWSDTYGDGQAVFGSISLITPYLIFNGQTRTETTRMEQPAGYGFRATSFSANSINGENANYTQVSYTELGGTWSASDSPNCSDPSSCLYFVYNQTGLTFTRCSFHNAGLEGDALAMMHGSVGATFDHCDFYMGWGKATIAAPNAGITTLTVKYCRFWNSSRLNTCPSEVGHGPGITCEIGSYSTDSDHVGHLFYGNIFYGTASGGRNGCLMFGEPLWSGAAQNIKVFNNTFAGFPEASVLGEIYLKPGSGNEARNNLFYDTAAASITANTISGTVDSGTDVFVDYANRDFRLAQAVSGATTLNSPYNLDPAGTTRGADGTFDVGAYEYESGTIYPPVITSSLTAVGTNGTAFSYTIQTSNSAVSFGATGLPTGITRTGATLSGTPSTGPSTNSITITATNSAGYDSETLVLTLYNGIAPSITSAPVAHTNGTATGVNLSVTATGSATLLYRWQLASTNITGATSATYSKVPANTNDSGLYRVVVTNNFGSVTSTPVYVSITNTLTPPEITSGSFTGLINVAMSYDIETTEPIDSYGVSGTLPNGVTHTAGTISGTPTEAGVFPLTISVTNAFGYDSEAMNLVISSIVDTNISVGSRVAVNISPTLRVRDAAALAGNILGEQNYQAEGTVTGGPTTADGYTWWEINYDTAPDGWSIEGTGGAYWLIVAPPDGDTTAPAISITSPASSPYESTSRFVVISGTASDNVGLSQVRLTGYWAEPQIATGTTNWTISTQFPNALGDYVVLATVIDTSSNTNTDTVTIRYIGATATIQTLRVGNTYIGQ